MARGSILRRPSLSGSHERDPGIYSCYGREIEREVMELEADFLERRRRASRYEDYDIDYSDGLGTANSTRLPSFELEIPPPSHVKISAVSSSALSTTHANPGLAVPYTDLITSWGLEHGIIFSATICD
ncbi:hypothetical protein MY11210_006467 [Beauveria gryllotalpidicola]